MSNPQISVIIPVYNVEKYLERCVKSVTQQTFTDLEIILVNDGSTDGSKAICDELAKEDTRIRVIHKENGGLSDARNTGIEAARGNYIGFVDSDDFIETNCFDVLYHLINKSNADIAAGSIYNCYETHKTPQYDKLLTFSCNPEEALKKMLAGKLITGSACCKLIRRELVKNRYFIVGKTYEDALYLPGLILDAKNIIVTTEPLYNYWHRSNSITTLPFSSTCMDIIEAYESTLEIVKKNCPGLIDVALFRLYWAYFIVLDRMIVTKNYSSIAEYKQVVKFLKKNWLKILCCSYFQKTRRIAAVILKINISLYRYFSLLLSKRRGVNK